MTKLLLLIVLALFASGSVARPIDHANVSALRELLGQPEGGIDMAKAKVAIDGMFHPAMDAEGTLGLIDQWADKVRSRIPEHASTARAMEMLASTLYEPGPWNDFRPFSYDYDQPMGAGDLSLATYLATRKGQCVTMPAFVVAVGQKLGLPVTLTTAPHHIMAKFGDEDLGLWMNLEATSGRIYDDGGYEHSMPMSAVSLDQGVYLRPHTQREAVALLMTASLGPVYKTMRADVVLRMTDLILEVDARNVTAMVIRANAHYMLIRERLLSRFPSVEAMPPDALAEFNALARLNREWFERAEALGWKRRTPEDWKRYLEHLANHKAAQQGER